MIRYEKHQLWVERPKVLHLIISWFDGLQTILYGLICAKSGIPLRIWVPALRTATRRDSCGAGGAVQGLLWRSSAAYFNQLSGVFRVCRVCVIVVALPRETNRKPASSGSSFARVISSAALLTSCNPCGHDESSSAVIKISTHS